MGKRRQSSHPAPKSVGSQGRCGWAREGRYSPSLTPCLEYILTTHVQFEIFRGRAALAVGLLFMPAYMFICSLGARVCVNVMSGMWLVSCH